MTPRLIALATLIALALPLPARAETAQFDLSIRGIRAGTLTFDGAAEAGRYAVTGRLESTGLVGLLRKIRFDGEVQGRIEDKRFTPARYVERADTGKRQSEAVMEYRRGVPQVKVYNPPRAPGDGGIDPARQGGTVDPLTAMFATLRDVPAGNACNLALTLFDGKRRSQVTLGPPQPREGGATCPGEYRRLEGFSADDMAEKSRFPFTVHLVPGPEGMLRVAEVTMESLYGNARLKRR
jgi:hypothetical protein